MAPSSLTNRSAIVWFRLLNRSCTVAKWLISENFANRPHQYSSWKSQCPTYVKRFKPEMLQKVYWGSHLILAKYILMLVLVFGQYVPKLANKNVALGVLFPMWTFLSFCFITMNIGKYSEHDCPLHAGSLLAAQLPCIALHSPHCTKIPKDTFGDCHKQSQGDIVHN